MHDLTAAHRTLPFSTRVVVVNRENERSVEVRINDRGPFIDGRIIDLSYSAARALDAIGPGIVPVRVRVMSLPSGAVAPPASIGAPGPVFAVQVGSFTGRDRAMELRRRIERSAGADGVAVVEEAVVEGETVYRVRVGAYHDREAARAAARRLAEGGYPALIVEH